MVPQAEVQTKVLSTWVPLGFKDREGENPWRELPAAAWVME